MKAAQALIKNAKLYPNGLFFLHLSIEKALKAIFVDRHGKHAPFSHNLMFLADACEIEFSANIKKGVSVINEFNMSTRYPNEQDRIKKKFNKRFSEKYLKIGMEIQEWLLDL